MSMMPSLEHLIKTHARILEYHWKSDPYRSQRLKTILHGKSRHGIVFWQHWRAAAVSVFLFLVLTILHLVWLGHVSTPKSAYISNDPFVNGLTPKTVTVAYNEVMPWSN